MQNKNNMGGAFKFICELYFYPLYICYKMTSHLYFLNFHLNTELYFYYFSVLSE